MAKRKRYWVWCDWRGRPIEGSFMFQIDDNTVLNKCHRGLIRREVIFADELPAQPARGRKARKGK